MALLTGYVFAQDSAKYPGIDNIDSFDITKIPCTEFNLNQEHNVFAPFGFKVEKNKIDYGNSLINNSLLIKIERKYFLYGKSRAIEINLLMFDFTLSRNEGEDVKQGEIIGTQNASGQKFIIVAESIDDYLVLMSAAKPVFYDNKYWFNPSFLFRGGSMEYLDYEEVDLNKVLIDVAKEATDEGPGYVFYPDYKIRFKISLSEYPEMLSDKQRSAISGYELRLYGKNGLNESYNEITIDGIKYLIIWQKGFNQYLRDEYALNADLWIYGALATYDFWQQEGYIFVRDFFPNSAEEILENHYKLLIGNGT